MSLLFLIATQFLQRDVHLDEKIGLFVNYVVDYNYIDLGITS